MYKYIYIHIQTHAKITCNIVIYIYSTYVYTMKFTHTQTHTKNTKEIIQYSLRGDKITILNYNLNGKLGFQDTTI